MKSPELQRANEQLRAATDALAEYDHLLGIRTRLANDAIAEAARVQHLTYELARERRDVEDRTAGVAGFFYALLGDEQLSIERREALEASARLGEAVASRDHLHAQLASIDARLARQSHSELAATVRTARATKADVLDRLHTPASTTLQDLAVRIESIEIELIPLEDAVLAGDAALTKLRAIIATLDRAHTAALEQSDARGMAGEAQATITVFQRAVDGLSTASEATEGFATLIDDADRQPFVDGWIRALVGDGDRTTRLTAARTSMMKQLERIDDQLTPVRARRDELATRRRALVIERERLLDST